MGRIFIAAGQGGLEDGRIDPRAIADDTTEAREMLLTRDQIVAELRSRNFEVLAVPDNLNLSDTLAWINNRARATDIALEIRADASTDPTVRGISVFYIANNEERKTHAELMHLALVRRVPQLPSKGGKPDTATGIGQLGFCRQIVVPSLLLEIGALTNPDDRFLLQTRRRDIALGIADGLSAWSRAVVSNGGETAAPYPPITITLNGQAYGEPGLLIHGNAYIPIDLVDRLGIDLSTHPNVRRLNYRNIVYLKAIDLRDFSISVIWDHNARTVALRSILRLAPGQSDRIMGYGSTSEVQLMMFLKTHNENALVQFPDIPKLYREEANIEGVNYDIAFCQMCLETHFLRLGGPLQPQQHNFAGLGAGGGTDAIASFPSARIGVRAQIQHLKAYASTEPLVQEIVDPRFGFVARGIAPTVEQLSGRWSADPHYGAKVLSILRRLYEAAGLL